MSYPTRQCALASVNWIQRRIPRCFGSIYGANRSVRAARRPASADLHGASLDWNGTPPAWACCCSGKASPRLTSPVPLTST